MQEFFAFSANKKAAGHVRCLNTRISIRFRACSRPFLSGVTVDFPVYYLFELRKIVIMESVPAD